MEETNNNNNNKQNNNKCIGIIIVLAVVLILVIGCLIYSNYKHKNNDDNNNGEKVVNIDYKIIYRYDNRKYDLEFKDNKIMVSSYDEIQCIKDPCDPIKSGSRTVKFKEEYQYLIDNYLKDKKEISITYEELDDKAKEMIHEIIDVKLETIGYEVFESDDDSNYKKRGYYVEEQDDGKVTIVIASGEKNTGGYSISVKNIDFVSGRANIYVEEQRPQNGETVTMGFTYPIVKIVMDEKPESMRVIPIDGVGVLEEITD